MTGNDQIDQIDTLSFEQLSPEFREEYVVLERRLFEQLSCPRQLLGQQTTGRTLADASPTFQNGVLLTLST